MKINDLFEEQQDEGIGSALGKVAGGIGKAVGGAVGGARAIGSAAKAGYKAGHAGAQQSILGQTFPDANLNPGGNAPAQQGAQAQQAGTAPAQGQQQAAPAVQQDTAPVQNQQDAPARQDAGFGFNGQTGEPFQSQEERDAYFKERGRPDPRKAQQTAAPEQGKVEPTMDQSQAPAGGQQQQQAPAKPAAMKGSEIAGELKGVWDKASADQGSMTGSPQVKQQIIAMAKAAGMTGMKIENRQFYSKFLGQNI